MNAIEYFTKPIRGAIVLPTNEKGEIILTNVHSRVSRRKAIEVMKGLTDILPVSASKS